MIHGYAPVMSSCAKRGRYNDQGEDKSMKRRQFLKTAGIGMAATTIAAPAIAQSMPALKWRMTASWPKSLDTLLD